MLCTASLAHQCLVTAMAAVLPLAVVGLLPQPGHQAPLPSLLQNLSCSFAQPGRSHGAQLSLTPLRA